EACAFRDQYDVFSEAGAEVIGVSRDSLDSHQRFAGKHRLPMTLAVDADGAVAERYGVKKTFGIIAGRATFVVDRAGRVVHTFSSQLMVTKHVAEALTAVKAAAAR